MGRADDIFRGFIRSAGDGLGFGGPKRGKDFGGEEYSEEYGECDVFEK